MFSFSEPSILKVNIQVYQYRFEVFYVLASARAMKIPLINICET